MSFPFKGMDPLYMNWRVLAVTTCFDFFCDIFSLFISIFLSLPVSCHYYIYIYCTLGERVWHQPLTPLLLAFIRYDFLNLYSSTLMWNRTHMCSLFSQLPLVCLTVLYRVCHFSFPNKTNKTILIGYNQDAESLACDIGDVLCIVLHPLAPEAHPPPSGGGEGRKGWEGGREEPEQCTQDSKFPSLCSSSVEEGVLGVLSTG